ncbi:receptor kinase-like protein Xa21 [Lycium ferocissimum]|uniref:receptor kinase-like protein Xa21 n=1 Tax=Lycium ferocissimum TaxID=112874 RepID=UPI00281651D4|nr:receptor kinase-like protein Xa21 [Lycium ferocissimum]
MRLYGNQISGHIPSNIYQLTELKVLSISLNNITGEIPTNIGCLAKLEAFHIGYNKINGIVPLSLGNISTLQYLSCPNNHIEGPIPRELGKLSNLRLLDFQENYNLIGEIPKDVFNISSMEVISLNLNNLSGRIPATTGLHLPNLKELYLAHNQIEGQIPPFITNASKLSELVLAANIFTGNIPNNLGSLRELEGLFLVDNQLISEPSKHELLFLNSLVNCRMLQYLSVGHNPLNGIFSNFVGNLSSTIEYFEVANAGINGSIPKGIGNMSGLLMLDFQKNNLMGSIPSEVSKLKKLQGLYLNNNKLQGNILEAVCQLSNLVQLTLYANELTGVIPENIGNLSMLQKLWLGSNKFESKLPLSLWQMTGLLHLNISRNSIQGEVQQHIGELKAIVVLDLSSNNFSGMIPSRIGDLENMQYLSLSNNSFLGSIPLSFANLISVEFMDLSLNSISGTIPKSLEKLSHLKSINVSFNDLEGEIPSSGMFANFTSRSFKGNRGLCGMHFLAVPACAITNPRHHAKSRLMPIVTLVVSSSFLIFLLVSIWIMKQQRKGKSKDVEKVPSITTYPLISYREIQRATNNFDVSNLIGVGGSSSVYKGTLSNGMVVAIKVLDMQNEEGAKRFDTECEVMRNVRHKNIITLITTCSGKYVRAFVLQYMPNGSLEDWLYKEECHLNLHQRVIIMLNVAVAIEYLHHGYDTPIVHCDLKLANVLLNEDMVAHVGDFGISKILAVSKVMTHTETLGTLGYIAPEYGSEGRVSTSGDVYSYGIMLIEVLTKRRPTHEEIFNENSDLRQWIRRAFPRTVAKVVNANIFHEKEHMTSQCETCIDTMIELALDCTKKKPESRITMKDVVKRLTKIKNTLET